jgi:hypothetical protein
VGEIMKVVLASRTSKARWCTGLANIICKKPG